MNQEARTIVETQTQLSVETENLAAQTALANNELVDVAQAALRRIEANRVQVGPIADEASKISVAMELIRSAVQHPCARKANLAGDLLQMALQVLDQELELNDGALGPAQSAAREILRQCFRTLKKGAAACKPIAPCKCYPRGKSADLARLEKVLDDAARAVLCAEQCFGALEYVAEEVPQTSEGEA